LSCILLYAIMIYTHYYLYKNINKNEGLLIKNENKGINNENL